MKKVFALTSIILVLLIVLTGCVNLNYEVTLNKDGTADVAYVYGFKKETLNQLGDMADSGIEEMKQNAENTEFQIEEYEDDEIKGFKASKHVENVSEISLEALFGEENIQDSEENQLKVEKKGLQTTYSQNAQIDLSSMAQMSSMVTIKYTIKLPTKVSDSNAEEVSEDGKTLTWNLKVGEINEINFTAVSSNVTLVIVATLVAVVAIAVIIVLVKSSKKNKKTKESNVTEHTENKEKIETEKKETVKKEESKQVDKEKNKATKKDKTEKS